MLEHVKYLLLASIHYQPAKLHDVLTEIFVTQETMEQHKALSPDLGWERYADQCVCHSLAGTHASIMTQDTVGLVLLLNKRLSSLDQQAITVSPWESILYKMAQIASSEQLMQMITILQHYEEPTSQSDTIKSYDPSDEMDAFVLSGASGSACSPESDATGSSVLQASSAVQAPLPTFGLFASPRLSPMKTKPLQPFDDARARMIQHFSTQFQRHN